MRALGLVLLMTLGLLASREAHAHASDVPTVEHATLIVRGGDVPRATFQARWSGTPSIFPTAASVRLRTENLDVGPLPLGAGGWRERRRGLRWRTSVAGDGVASARLTFGRHGDRLRLVFRDQLLTQPLDQHVTVIFTIGDVRLCADFAAGAPRRPGRLRLDTDGPFAPCPCDDEPASTWEAIQRRLIARHGCLEPRCHGVAPGSAGLDLTPAAAYDDLIGVPSDADPDVARVVPGNPTTSMLWRKLAASTLGLEDVPGNSMPIGARNLDTGELDALVEWITAGAPRTGSVPAADVLLGACPAP